MTLLILFISKQSLFSKNVPNFWWLPIKQLYKISKITPWELSFGCKIFLNFSCLNIRFHNCLHVNFQSCLDIFLTFTEIHPRFSWFIITYGYFAISMERKIVFETRKTWKANFGQSPLKSYMLLGHKSPFYVKKQQGKLCCIVDEHSAISYAWHTMDSNCGYETSMKEDLLIFWHSWKGN